MTSQDNGSFRRPSHRRQLLRRRLRGLSKHNEDEKNAADRHLITKFQQLRQPVAYVLARGCKH